MSRDADMRFGHCKCSLHLAHAGGVLRHAPLWWRSAGTGGREAAGGHVLRRGGQIACYPPKRGVDQRSPPQYFASNDAHNTVGATNDQRCAQYDRRDDALRRRSHQVLSVLSFSRIRSPHSAQFAFMPHRDPDVLHICSICLSAHI